MTNFLKAIRRTVFAILMLPVTTVHGQSYEPLELAKKIFGKDSLPHIENYITGEYNGHPNGQDLFPGAITKFMLLEQTDTKSVIVMTILDSTRKGLDTYLHFKKDSIWRLSAFRALAMTGMIEEMKNELEAMTPKQIDELIKKSKRPGKPEEGEITSREDYEFELGNARLTLELDDNIIKHFEVNKARFEQLKDSALNELSTKKTKDEGRIGLLKDRKKDYHKLFISSVSFGDYELGGDCLNFLIGGILDNTVGYLYIKDKKDLPEMSDSNVIMIREIGNGWYIYKTT
jgi:hypothetical protein